LLRLQSTNEKQNEPPQRLVVSNNNVNANIRIRIPIKLYCKINKPLSLQDISSAIWDEKIGPHKQGNSFGKLIQDLELAIKKLK